LRQCGRDPCLTGCGFWWCVVLQWRGARSIGRTGPIWCGRIWPRPRSRSPKVSSPFPLSFASPNLVGEGKLYLSLTNQY
jgi:hypothetical protein